MLEGHVFHVTKRENWTSIAACGEIRPNCGSGYRTSFGSYRNSYFRNLGCISVFDWRIPPNNDITDFRARCHPLQPASPDNDGIVILFLNPALHDRLIPWTGWRDSGDLSQMVVPYVEAGYPGAIPLDHIDSAIFFTLTEDPNSVAATFRRVRRG